MVNIVTHQFIPIVCIVSCYVSLYLHMTYIALSVISFYNVQI